MMFTTVNDIYEGSDQLDGWMEDIEGIYLYGCLMGRISPVIRTFPISYFSRSPFFDGYVDGVL